ncbi:MAG TPA: hypothetical protein VJ653_07520 [Acidimicrobiales bacterium]|nr:hypothetical protein [Acidimicrobiales bacterium]
MSVRLPQILDAEQEAGGGCDLDHRLQAQDWVELGQALAQRRVDPRGP